MIYGEKKKAWVLEADSSSHPNYILVFSIFISFLFHLQFHGLLYNQVASWTSMFFTLPYVRGTYQLKYHP